MKYQLVVVDFPHKPSSEQMRALRLIGKQSLKDVVEMANYARGMPAVTLADGVARDVAERLCDALRGAGLNASSRASESRSPIVLRPALATGYRWSWGRMTRSS